MLSIRALTAVFLVTLSWASLLRTGVPVQRGTHMEASLQGKVLRLMEDLVRRERFHRQIHGYYTRLTSRLAFEVPEEMRDVVQIEILDVARDRLLIHAFTTYDAPTDHLWMDQSFVVQANFKLMGGRWVQANNLAKPVNSEVATPDPDGYPWGLLVEAVDSSAPTSTR